MMKSKPEIKNLKSKAWKLNPEINSLKSNSAVIEKHFVAAGRRLDYMDMALTRLVESMRALQAAFTTPGTAPPQTFNMSTLAHPPQQPQPTANQSHRPLVEDVHLVRIRRTSHSQCSPE